jgi:6-pyruvoyltetrahydropterin/6-carboxytetrahydropterin synthase
MKITHAFTFEAAHRMPYVEEDHLCYKIHGHSYRVELCLEGKIDPKTGFVFDFFEIERIFKPILKKLDHNYLNEIEGLDIPSVENITVWVWNRIQPHLPQLCAVTVYETPNCWATFEGK